MRLTALRQSLKDVPGPMNPRQMKRESTTNDLPSPHVCQCKHPPPKSEKRRRTGQYGTPESGAVHAPHNTNLHYPLYELTTRITGTRKGHLLLNSAPNKSFPRTLALTYTRHPTGSLGADRLGNEMRSQNGGEPNAWTSPLASRRHTPPLLTIYMAKHREHSEANYPRERNAE